MSAYAGSGRETAGIRRERAPVNGSHDLSPGSYRPRHARASAMLRSRSSVSATPEATARCLRLITWNVARRRSRIVEQATALAARKPDVVALQEVTRRTDRLWRTAFELMGLVHVRASLDDANPAREPAARRTTAVMLASRTPLCDVRQSLVVPWPETALCAAAETSRGPVEVCCVHVPNAANGLVKIKTLHAIRLGVLAAEPAPRVVCGDLNTPRRELPGGEVISFARDSRGRLRPERARSGTRPN